MEERGLLDRLGAWLTAGPPPGLDRTRPVLVGTPAEHVLAISERFRFPFTAIPSLDADSGAAWVDREVDGGIDLFLLAVPAADWVSATVAIAAFTGEEPVRALGFDHTLPDREWIRRAVAVRDGLHRIEQVSDRAGVLATLGDPALATAVGIVSQAAVRRTPVVLDGLSALAAAVIVTHFGETPPLRCLLASTDPRPAATAAARMLGITPTLHLGRPSGDGMAALLTLPLLQAAQLVSV